jgi:hypothetical protein
MNVGERFRMCDGQDEEWLGRGCVAAPSCLHPCDHPGNHSVGLMTTSFSLPSCLPPACAPCPELYRPSHPSRQNGTEQACFESLEGPELVVKCVRILHSIFEGASQSLNVPVIPDPLQRLNYILCVGDSDRLLTSFIPFFNAHP